MSYKNDKVSKFIVEAETKFILNSLDNLIDRYIYIVGSVCDLLEIEDEKKATEYIQNKIIENVENSEIFKEFNLIFRGN